MIDFILGFITENTAATLVLIGIAYSVILIVIVKFLTYADIDDE